MSGTKGAPAPESQPPAPQPPAQKTLRFTKTFNKYHRGDHAGFPAAYADQLIAKGVAVEWTSPQSRAVDQMVRK